MYASNSSIADFSQWADRAVVDVNSQVRDEQHNRCSAAAAAAAEVCNFTFARAPDHCATCPPGAPCRQVGFVPSTARQWELSMPQSSHASCDQDPFLASAVSRRRQARSRNMTPPPAPCRGLLSDMPAVQPGPVSDNGQPQQADDQQQAKPARCRRISKLLAMLVLVLVLHGLSAGFQTGTAKELVAIEEFSVFATSATRVMLKSPLQKVAVFTHSASQAVLVLVEESLVLQQLAELKASARKALIEQFEKSSLLQSVLDLTASAKEAVLTFCTDCMLRSWAQSMGFASRFPPPEAVIVTMPASQACVSGRCSSTPLDNQESVCINFRPDHGGEKREDRSSSLLFPVHFG
eukprot:TRINITY_DN4225_c0_g1_i1.p1 TRINITY_DN4225_c0_g1~~TRINITY_DN4225_c0_g1_i1.p1  ORF type:complete len:373 (+),score=64.42 TRINITY_DN4225_c0_g1_i1:71-1120(+)